ncbi:MAG: YfhO family protein [Proteobacteria bacterium]|nr:YfhO family protein [Pseudomonadota bacterium]
MYFNGKAEGAGWWSRYRYPLILALVLILPFIDILIVPHGRILGNGACDNAQSYYFMADYTAQQFREFRLPIWSPLSMLGIPFLAQGEASVFHPLSLLYFIMPTGVAINWLIAINFVLAGLAFYGYLRSLILGRQASFLGALVWSFSSIFSSRIYAGHLNYLLCLTLMPLILMLWERYRLSNNIRFLAGISLCYGLMLLAFYPQITYIFSIFILLYVVLQGVAASNDPVGLRREAAMALRLGGAILLGIGFGAIQLFPSLDFISQSFRQQATIEFAGSFSFPIENLLTLIAPGFFGTKWGAQAGQYWGRNYFWEMWMYLGVFPLTMALAGVWGAPAKRRWMFVICIAVFMLLGLGKNTPLFPFIYAHVPLFDLMRGSSKITLMAMIALITLSSYGFDAFLGMVNQRRRTAKIAIWVALVLGIALAGLLIWLEMSGGSGGAWRALLERTARSGDPTILADSPDAWQNANGFFSGATKALSIGLILAGAGLMLLFWARSRKDRLPLLFPAMILLIALDLLPTFLSLERTTFDQSLIKLPAGITEYVRQFPYPPRLLMPLEDNTVPNIALSYGYSSAFGYMNNTLKRYNTFISLAQNHDPRDSRAVAHFFQETPAFRVLAYDAAATWGRLPGSSSGQWNFTDLSYNNRKIPRAFLATVPRYMDSEEEALAYVLAPDTDLLHSPAIERGNNRPGGQGGPLDSGEQVRFVSFSPERIELEVVSTAVRELVLCEMYEKNWTATVNGVPAALVPANYLFRSVQVPAGTSTIVFEYRPRSFYLGCAVSALSLLLLLFVCLRRSKEGSES